jgi:hypothetical protein
MFAHQLPIVIIRFILRLVGIIAICAIVFIGLMFGSGIFRNTTSIFYLSLVVDVCRSIFLRSCFTLRCRWALRRDGGLVVLVPELPFKKLSRHWINMAHAGAITAYCPLGKRCQLDMEGCSGSLPDPSRLGTIVQYLLADS